MKECPYCAEEIQDRAIKCRYCGEWLQDPPTGRIAKTASKSDFSEEGLSWEEPHLKPILKCPTEDLVFLTRALAKHLGENFVKTSSEAQTKAQGANFANKIHQQRPEALLAIYRIFQLCDHDEIFT